MQRLTLLDDENYLFPDIDDALVEPNGLLAAGGDLSSGRLLAAYRLGIFPWYDEEQPILWWSPDPRCVIDPLSFKPSRTLARRIRRHEFEIRVDTDFASVIDACCHRGDNGGTWITRDMIDAYLHLHDLGVAHSIEAYRGDTLAGGLYGLAIGPLFFGESMFHRETDASKVAFAALMQLMVTAGSPMVDCQISNPHLLSLGAVEIPRQQFQLVLHQNIDKPGPDWTRLRGRFDLAGG